MPELGVIVVLALATFRLTRVVAVDSISLSFREVLYHWAWVFVNGDGQPVREGELAADARPRAPWRTWMYTLVTCQQCLGVWVGVAVYSAWRWGGDVALAILAVAAVCGAQSFLAWATETAGVAAHDAVEDDA
jgi:hypothetical protein